MGLLRISTAALALVGSALAAPVEERATSDKVCDAATKICYSSASAGTLSLGFAISDTAAAGKPFDVLLSITAPKATGWAAVAWGGQMAGNPLTIGWANGASAQVSSREAT